jgi:hypothetical protein
VDRYKYYHLLAPLYSSGIKSRAMQIMEEKALRTPRSAAAYASYVVGKWPKAEPVILQNPMMAVDYAENTLEDRWPEAEPIIMRDGPAAETYAMSSSLMGETRWLEAEPFIFDLSKNDPRYYFREFFDGWDFNEVPDYVQPYWLKEFGECAQCGDGLSQNERKHWRLNDDWGDEKFCSERCADKASEGQHEANVQYWVEDSMNELNDPAPDKERIEAAQQYINRYPRFLEDQDAVVRALRRGEFVPEEDDDES